MRQPTAKPPSTDRQLRDEKPLPLIGPQLLREEFAAGALTAKTISEDGRRNSGRSHVSNYHRRFVLWARAEGFSYGQIERACGLSPEASRGIVAWAEDDTRRFSECGFVARFLTGRNNTVPRYLDRFCGTVFSHAIDANQCAYDHVFFKGRRLS